jgi:hypothetical protein
MKPLLVALIALALFASASANARQSSGASRPSGVSAAKSGSVVSGKHIGRARRCRLPCPVYGEPFTEPYDSNFGSADAPDSQPAVICEVRREQLTDLYGWRVRDVTHCSPR